MKEKQIEEMAFNLIMATSPLGVKDLTKQFDYNTVAKDLYELYGWRKQEWISVEDRLPSKSGYYLICQKSSRWCDEVIQTARWNEKKFRGAQAGCFMEHVTHWMPLPDAPKGGEGK